MAIKQPDRIESNNPKAYGIVKADEVSGHKSVKNLTELLAIPDCILSTSGNNLLDDAIGQIWYVISEKRQYKLEDWSKRKSIDGWDKGLTSLKGYEGSVPLYASVDDVPDDKSELPDEYFVSDEGTPVFNVDEEKAMMMKAILALQKEVNKIKRSFTDHLDCGGFTNTKMLIVASDESVEAKEPIWASDDGTSAGIPEVELPELEPGNPDLYQVTHLTIKSIKWDDYQKVVGYLLPNEMLWVYDNERLYIKQQSGKMFWINKNSGGGGEDPDPEIPSMDNVEYIEFISPNKTKFMFTMTDNGEIKIVNMSQESEPDKSGLVESGTFKDMSKTLYLPNLYINSVYCGGLDAENPAKYQPCSHNFVELSNVTAKDIHLKGLSLQYSINGTQWDILPLEGIIKSGSTFLIRGASCSIMEANTTRLKVKTFDMEWKDKNNKLIKFSDVKCKFLLTYDTVACDMADPYRQDSTAVEKAYCKLGYIDMVGMHKPGATAAESIDGYEQAAFAQLVPAKRLYMKYYALDNVSQAIKTVGKRKNSTDWTWIELEKDLQPEIENYTPRASFEKKNIFYDKTPLNTETPNMVTVTFGRNAHTTRCFNWISVGYYDEFLQYRKEGAATWTTLESFKEDDARTTYTSKYYNRIRVQSTEGTCYTSHKLIVTGLTAGTYEYKCGATGRESEIFKFKVVAKSTTTSWKFVHTSDQQGFNWIEYEVWRKTAEYIKKNVNPLFTLNTGDMTQNGNRLNEWLDYYEAGKSLFNGSDNFAGVEQMNIIGNNDLCPENFELLGNGSDLSKLNSINFRFFYTYEMDEANLPIIEKDGSDYFIPSLYSFEYNDVHFIMVNSEIPDEAQNILFGGADVYSYIKQWCIKDLDKTTCKWKVAACHEMPFTIITRDVINSYLKDSSFARGGSRLNTDCKSGDTYWFSRMLESKGVRLCLGGHKHTYSYSYPIKENVVGEEKKTMMPIIETTDPAFEASLSAEDRKLCQVQVVAKPTAPVYVMCQASGYKQTSNKELPAENVVWLKGFFPSSVNATTGVRAPNSGQQYPFYIVWTIEPNRIVGDVVKLNNIMTAGKFNINSQNKNPIAPLNGNGTLNSQIIIEL